MKRYLPIKEKLTPFEWIVPLGIFLITLGLINGYKVHNGLTEISQLILIFLSFSLGLGFGISQFQRLFLWRLKRLYSYLTWFMISLLLFVFSNFLVNGTYIQDLNIPFLMKYPLISIIYFQITRMIHITIHKREPIGNDFWGVITMDEYDDISIDESNKNFNIFFGMIGNLIIFLIVMINLK